MIAVSSWIVKSAEGVPAVYLRGGEAAPPSPRALRGGGGGAGSGSRQEGRAGGSGGKLQCLLGEGGLAEGQPEMTDVQGLLREKRWTRKDKRVRELKDCRKVSVQSLEIDRANRC